MVSRIQPPEDGGPARSSRTTGLLALVLVLAVALGVWLLDGNDSGASSTVAGDTTGLASPSPTPEAPSEAAPSVDSETDQPGSSAAPSPTVSATPEPTPQPSIDPDSGLPTVYLLDLPPEAAETVDVIDRGPPFPYSKDGSTFGNYEGLLPDYERGYYQEFTVETPGSYDRGARRIVEGAEGELYWTDDHYESFSRILL